LTIAGETLTEYLSSSSWNTIYNSFTFITITISLTVYCHISLTISLTVYCHISLTISLAVYCHISLTISLTVWQYTVISTMCVLVALATGRQSTLLQKNSLYKELCMVIHWKYWIIVILISIQDSAWMFHNTALDFPNLGRDITNSGSFCPPTTTTAEGNGTKCYVNRRQFYYESWQVNLFQGEDFIAILDKFFCTHHG
jgi:hypothetical protein